jgi:hypothetical protein
MPCRRISISAKGALLALALLCPFAALSQVAPVIFQRVNIRIDPVLPAIEQAQGAVQVRPSTPLNVEVRGEDALKLEYIHTLNMLAENSGVMILLDAPAILPLPAFRNYQPVDALFIDARGTILQIMPNLVLADLARPVAAKEPVRGILFLKAGTAQARLIRPHDIVAGGMFDPGPPVIQ